MLDTNQSPEYDALVACKPWLADLKAALAPYILDNSLEDIKRCRAVAAHRLILETEAHLDALVRQLNYPKSVRR